ncbi:unnamed protein product, partial [Durusdinium trenchii]
SFTFGREWLCHAEDQLNPVSRSWIVEEAPNGATREVSLDFALWFQGVAERLRLFSMPSPALVHLRGLHRNRMELHGVRGPCDS